jgi:hypothetical protein
MHPQLTSRSGLALIATVGALILMPAAAQAQKQDLRSPDTRDAAAAAVAHQDLRSPDTRDAAEGRTPDMWPVVVPQPAPVVESGFDWLDAVVGFAAAIGLVLLLTAGALLARRRTRHAVAA